MELENLMLGILYSTAVFAIKTGIGLHYYLDRERRKIRQLTTSLAFLGIYGFLFAAAALALRHVDVSTHFQAVQLFLKSGMSIHLVLAGLMLFWGVALLKADRVGPSKSSGWLLLAIPCPVCLTVIIISEAFLIAFFPQAVTWAILALYGVFISLCFSTVLLAKGWRHFDRRSPEAILGSIMMIVAAYFLLSVIVMPHFARLGEVYRLAAHAGQANETKSGAYWGIHLVSGLLFVLGYLQTHRRIRRNS